MNVVFPFLVRKYCFFFKKQSWFKTSLIYLENSMLTQHILHQVKRNFLYKIKECSAYIALRFINRKTFADFKTFISIPFMILSQDDLLLVMRIFDVYNNINTKTLLLNLKCENITLDILMHRYCYYYSTFKKN